VHAVAVALQAQGFQKLNLKNLKASVASLRQLVE